MSICPREIKLLLARLIFGVALCFLTTGSSLAQGDVNKFRYQPEKIKVGTVYHYLKTNLDGTHPEHVSIYVAAKNRLESFKFHPRAARAGLVMGEMDWDTFSVKSLESWQVFKGGEKKLFATLAYLKDERAVEVAIAPLNRKEKTAIKHLPWHVYNFDLASLNFAFRHLVNPRGRFVVGITDPTFKEEGQLFQYRGEAAVAYVSEEIPAGLRCRKYRIDGAGLENRGGFIWVNKRLGHIEDMEIALPDNPDWQSFKFRLSKVQRMSRDEWEAFMKAQF